MERVYQLLIDYGYPKEGVDWLRKRRLPAILILVVASWAILLAIGYLLYAGVSALIQLV